LQRVIIVLLLLTRKETRKDRDKVIMEGL